MIVKDIQQDIKDDKKKDKKKKDAFKIARCENGLLECDNFGELELEEAYIPCTVLVHKRVRQATRT